MIIDTKGLENRKTNNRDIKNRLAEDTMPGPMKDEPIPTRELTTGLPSPIAASMPSMTGLSAIWWTRSGLISFSKARIRDTSVRTHQRERVPRVHSRGCKTNPSPSIEAACLPTRVATCTSNPAARAARAIGRRCEMKNQSSVTR